MTPTATPGEMVPWIEDAWLGRYLDDLLSEDEIAWFEQYVLDKPRLLALIDADTQLRRAVTAAGRDGMNIAAQPTDTDEERGAAQHDAAVRAQVTAPRRRLALRWIAAAAALVLGIGVGRMTLRTDSAALVANPTRAVYDTMRGASMPPRVEHGGAAGGYVLIEVSVPSGARDVTVRLADGSTAALVPAADGFVRFLVHSTALESNDTAEVDYTVDGQSQSRPLSFDKLHRGR